MTQRLLTCLAAAVALSLWLSPASSQERSIDDFETLEGWHTGGQKEASLKLSGQWVKRGKRSLNFHVEIDHQNAEAVKKVKYPMGWPSITKEYGPPIDVSDYDFLEFDIYFASKRGVDPDFALHITIRDSKGRGIYGTTLIDLRHGKWAHVKLCIRDVPAAKGFANLHFYLSESVYDHGDVVDFYIDNLRATKAADYRPPEVRPVRHPVAKSDAAVLWTEGPCRKVLRTEKVDLSRDADPVVGMSAARNETEAVQLVVRPLVEGGVGRVSVEVGELTGPDGAKIAAKNVSWSPVYYVPANEGPPEGSPDALPGPKPFVADKPWHYPIWLEVYVPPGTRAGDYAAPVRVHTARGDLRAELRLHVWDFDVPVKQHLRTSTTIYGPWGWRKDIKTWFGDIDYGQFTDDWRPKMVKMLARYRLCPAHLRHLPLRYDKDNKKVTLRDTTEFERFVRSYLAMGHHFDCMPVPYFYGRPSFLGAKKGTEEYLKRITDAFRVAAEYLDKKGWLEGSYVYCVDEVVVHKHSTKRDFGLLNRVFDAIHAAHPKIRLFGAETPSPLLRGMDVWCINLGCFDTDVLAEQHALGKKVWWYNGYRDPRPGTRIAARGVDHRALFWITYKYGIDGYLIWTVNRWTTNPWEEPNRGKRTAAGNHFLLYGQSLPALPQPRRHRQPVHQDRDDARWVGGLRVPLVAGRRGQEAAGSRQARPRRRVRANPPARRRIHPRLRQLPPHQAQLHLRQPPSARRADREGPSRAEATWKENWRSRDEKHTRNGGA